MEVYDDEGMSRQHVAKGCRFVKAGKGDVEI